MGNLPEDIRRIICHSASLDGLLRYGGDVCNWEELSQWEDTPRDAGLYMVGLKLGIQYERAVSRIAYIGSTCNLRTRIQTHNVRSHNCFLELLKRRYPAGLIVTWLALPGLSVEWLRALEDAALQEARQQFGLYPICNMGRIDSPRRDDCANLVRILPCDGLPFPCSLQTLSKQLSSKSLGQLPEWKLAENQIAANVVGVTDALAAPGGNDLDPWIVCENVATWNLEKIQQLVQVCKSLEPVAKHGTSKVRTFSASIARVRRPHTWGEVALVQARIVAGTWCPTDRLWVKIACGKQLLGQAILENDFYRGEDKSDLPQTRKRRTIRDSKALQQIEDSIQDELPADFIPTPYAIADLPSLTADDPVSVEHHRLLSVSRSFDIEEAHRMAEFDRERAIEWAKSRRITELLNSQIEATFLAAIGQ